ncbi:sigma 54-interacting transcriptional regulator [Candidatus Latescibacterota bacterium]
MNTNVFFREATLRICSNLEIVQSLKNCFDLIEQYMPVDALYLERYHEDMMAMHFLASAHKDSCKYMDTLLRLPDISREIMVEMEKQATRNTIEGVIVFNRSDEMPMNKHVLDLLDIPPSSVMTLPLMIGSECVGALDLFAHGEDRFTEEHIRVFAILREPMALALANAFKHHEIVQLKNLLADDNRFLQRELHQLAGDEIICADFGLKEVMYKAKQVAALDSPVLLLGETGVGKDVIANAIHFSSSRSEGPFVKVNCGAIPDTLIDSELFGHEKGAFTGAMSKKRGRFERADTGTIFLDEIGELPLEAQVRLLNVLQNKEIERVGGTKTISLDIRIIAATNRNLEKMVREKQFREDLWFRLNVFPIFIPPLRERISDIPALLQHFITSKSKELKLPSIPSVSAGAIDFLMEYSWPGNVRELQNVVERELILNPKGPLGFNDMNLLMNKGNDVIQDHISETYNLDEINARHIRRILSKTNGIIHGPGGAAELLGINANTLRNRMNKLGIEYKKIAK